MYQAFQATACSIYLFIQMVKTTIEKLIKRDFVEQNEQGLFLYKE